MGACILYSLLSWHFKKLEVIKTYFSRIHSEKHRLLALNLSSASFSMMGPRTSHLTSFCVSPRPWLSNRNDYSHGVIVRNAWENTLALSMTSGTQYLSTQYTGTAIACLFYQNVKERSGGGGSSFCNQAPCQSSRWSEVYIEDACVLGRLSGFQGQWKKQPHRDWKSELIFKTQT